MILNPDLLLCLKQIIIHWKITSRLPQKDSTELNGNHPDKYKKQPCNYSCRQAESGWIFETGYGENPAVNIRAIPGTVSEAVSKSYPAGATFNVTKALAIISWPATIS